MGARREIIKAGSHVKLNSIGINQRQIDSSAHGVGRPSLGISQKIWVRGVFPKDPLRLRRTKRIKHLEAQVDGLGQSNRRFKIRSSVGVKITSRPGIYRFAGKIPIRGIRDVEVNIENRWRNLNKH